MPVIVERDAENNDRQTEKTRKMWMFSRPTELYINDFNLGSILKLIETDVANISSVKYAKFICMINFECWRNTM